MSHRALALAAAVRVVVRVHNRAADGGTYTEVSGLARLAHAYNLVLDVAYLSDSRLAFKRIEPIFVNFDSSIMLLLS